MPLDAQFQQSASPDHDFLLSLSERNSEHVPSTRKAAGAYYTPDAVAASLCRWAIRSDLDLLLDPACGDGRFIAKHLNSVGVDQDSSALRAAIERAPRARCHHADFFAWALTAPTRFDCVVGNPPFIRYQRFTGETRRRALVAAAQNGATFSRLTSAWAPFLVVAASLLKPGGRAAFVVPAEIGHAPYAAPVLEYFTQNFALVQVVAVRKKLFPDLSEDCWLLYAEGFGARTDKILFSALESFHPTAEPPPASLSISLAEWRDTWKRRLRPLLMPQAARLLYQYVATSPATKRFGDLASIGIGYVSGGNDFFHLNPSKATELGITSQFLHPTVRNGRKLATSVLTTEIVTKWLGDDEPMLLLNIPKTQHPLPKSLLQYLETEEATRVRQSYKCRHREPWYSVPDVRKPDYFLSYLSGRSVALVKNAAGCTCSNALHYVHFKDQIAERWATAVWETPFVRLSCEVEGHPLGGGLLKLEPREAASVIFPDGSLPDIMAEEVVDGVAALQTWRHYKPPSCAAREERR